MKRETYYPDFFYRRLSGRLHIEDLHEIISYASNESAKQALYRLLFDENKRVAENAAWIFTHFDPKSNRWLYDKHNELINEVMRTTSDTRRRLLLSLLLRQPFRKTDIHTDFLDFCLQRMISVAEPTAVRVLCIKLAYEQCRFFPELLAELQITLDTIDPSLLPTGLKSTRKNILNSITKILK